MQSQHTFETHPTFEKIRLVLVKLEQEKNKLTKELEIEKTKRTQNESLLESTLTERKYHAITELLNNFNDVIRDYNARSFHTDEKDKTAEFWTVVKLACHVNYTRTAYYYTLIEYRSYGKPIAGSLAAAGLTGLFFFASLPVSILAGIALYTGVKAANSKITNYAALPTSFAIVAELSDVILDKLNQLLPDASLPNNYDIESSYRLLGLEPSASHEQIEERKTEINSRYNQILISLKNKDAKTCHEQCIYTANDIARVTMASFVAAVYSLQNNKAYHLRINYRSRE